jgi:hypothetical protein
MQLSLSAYTERTVPMNGDPETVARYFSQNESLLAQLVGPDRVDRLGEGLFRVHTRGFAALGLEVTPSFDVAFTDLPGVIRMASQRCHLLHGEQFDLEASFEGEAQFHPAAHGTALFCWTEARAELDLPPWLSFAPRSLVTSTLEAIMHGALEAMSGRFVPLIQRDFAAWAEHAVDPA